VEAAGTAAGEWRHSIGLPCGVTHYLSFDKPRGGAARIRSVTHGVTAMHGASDTSGIKVRVVDPI
jgi:hypothetical protein